MSAVNRSRRKNAGKRMAALGKKMEEEDETFWSHETWAEDEDSGNESFHESDEDSALRKDVFDSDFNDSESDNEEDEMAAGEAEEKELRKSEREGRRQKSNIHSKYKKLNGDSSHRGKGKRGFPGMKRILGEGSNAGIVLNLPPGILDSLAYSMSLTGKESPQQTTQRQEGSLLSPPPLVPTTVTNTVPGSNNNNLLVTPKSQALSPPIALAATVAVTPVAKPPIPAVSTARKTTRRTTAEPVTRSSRSSSREKKSMHKGRTLRDRSGTAATSGSTKTSKPTDSSSRNKSSNSASAPSKQKAIAQEELLLEAVHETEPENQRWLHGRKRVQDQHDRDKDSNTLRDKHRGKKVIQKFHSRRGCLITLTFPEMDAVPEILTRRHQHDAAQQQQPDQSQEAPQHTAQQSVPAISVSTSSDRRMSNHRHQQSSRCVITGKAGRYKDPLTKHTYHDLAAFKELRRRHKNGTPIVKKSHPITTGSSQKSGVPEGSKKRKAQSTTAQNGAHSRKRTHQGEKNKRSTMPTVDGTNSEKAKEVEKRNIKSSSATNANPKLPFQSPIPPSNGTKSTTPNQPKQGLENLALSWDKKGSPSTTNSLSPSSRRLSQRKWKPSGKVLETIGMLAGKEGGNASIAAAVPKGLGLISQEYDSTNLLSGDGLNTSATVPNRTNSSSAVALELPMAPTLVESKSTTEITSSNHEQANQNETQESVVDENRQKPKDNGSSRATVVSTAPLTSVSHVGNTPSDVITAKLEDTTSSGNDVVMKDTTGNKTLNGITTEQVQPSVQKSPTGTSIESNREIA